MDVCAAVLHGLSHIGELLLRTLSCVLLRKHPHLRRGKCRTAFPHGARQIRIRRKRHVFLLHQSLKLKACLCIDNAAVKAQDPVFRERLRQIRFDGGNSLLPHFHELRLLAFQLVCRLYKVAAVGPEPGKVLRNHHGSRRTCEAGEEFPALKIRLHVLGIMEIRGRDVIRIHAVRLHLLPELSQSFVCHFFVTPVSIPFSSIKMLGQKVV